MSNDDCREKSANQQGVSIVICCFNSEKRLPETLQHLWKQDITPQMQLEVLLVDNNCTDMTIDVALKNHSSANTRIPLRIIEEKTPGLTFARIAGIRNATFDTVILCDDDNWLDADYCSIAHEILEKNPVVGLAGGCSEGVFEVEPPNWFFSISGAWALGSSDYRGLLEGDKAFLRGAGLILRRTHFLELLDSGFEFIASDRKGKALNSGGDSEISHEFLRRGHRLYFDGRLKLKHWIPANRLTREYALRLWEGFGAGTIPGDADRVTKLKSQRIRNFFRTSWLYQVTRGFIQLAWTSINSPIFNRIDPRPSLAWCSLKGRIWAIASLRSEYRRKILKRIAWIETVTTSQPTDTKLPAQKQCNISLRRR